MLNDAQIDYLLQIKETKPPLSERTVRVMLQALRWPPSVVDQGIAFLKKPPAPYGALPPPPVFVEPPPPALAPKPIEIKQNPFPVGSSHFRDVRRHEASRKNPNRHYVLGALFGLAVFIAGLILYARFL